MLEADLAEMIADLPQSFVYGSSTYACIADELTESDKHVEVGFMDEATLSLTTRQSLFTTLPEKGKTLIYNSATYRVEQVIKDPSGIGLRLICSDEVG